jgi:hypothetical protein
MGEILFVFRFSSDLFYVKDEQHRFLSIAGQLPARLTAEQAGWVLNCQTHDIPALVAARLVKPLGNPAPNAIKFFCTADLLELSKDRGWLVKLTNTITQHWQKQNARNAIGSHAGNNHAFRALSASD